MDYTEACRLALIDQQLHHFADMSGAVVEQTGGFCMAVTRKIDTGTLVVSYDINVWLIGYFEGDDWSEGEGDTWTGSVEISEDGINEVKRFMSLDTVDDLL